MTSTLNQVGASAVDVDALRAEIEDTRATFEVLVSAVTDDIWRTRRPGSSWSGKELLEHVTFALEQLPKEIESGKRGKGLFNYPKFIADPGSYWLTKWEARKSTRETILSRYNSAIANTLAALETVKPGEWSLGAKFYGEGFYSLEDLFHTPARHLEEHAVHLK